MKKSTLVYFGILLVVLLVLASNTRGLIEKPETKIDKKILDELEEKSEVLVIVSLKEPNLTDKEVKEIKTKKQIYKQKQDEVLSTLSLKDFKTKNIYTLSPGFSGYITKSGLEKLKIDPNVNNIHLSRKGEYILESTVPLINADDVWKLQKDGVNITGSTQSVCIIDSGIDFSHPDFSDCNQTKFSTGNCKRIISGYDYANLDSIPDDTVGHGTFVASIVGSNNSLINGVAPQSKLIILKNGNSTPDEDATQMSVEWCYNNRTKFNTSVITISSSLGAASTTDNCFSTNDLSIAIRSAYDVGIAITIASGNDGSKTQISYPACVNGSISVGASNDDDKMSAFSNRNANLDVVAPGENICAARASSASFGSPICIDSQHAISQGTSFATPHVAGAVALLQDAYNGTLKPGQIQEALNASGKSIHDSFLFFLNRRTFYRVDVKAALEYLPVLNVRHLDWPTDHHDYRRTGFTLLKGDVNKAADIDASNVALKDSVTSDIVIRPSVSDLDNNEHQDVVTVIHPLGDAGSDVYAVERRDRILNRWWMNTNQRWHLSIPTSYPLLPPTLANIDSDNQKEVLVGLRNGTLIAYDVASSGNSISEKWRYKFNDKYTQIGGATIIDYGGGTAVADIDLDGNPEVITADWGSRSAYDWPGEVYVIDGATGVKEGNATFGNGGAFASVSIANIDSDDNPEIIVPSFYGVFVYDYNTSTPNKLTQKCSTGDGLIDGSVVVYDVDRDNQYELIYTTTTQYCSTSKTCYNRLYIKNAQTCADESPSPISLSVYSRVTPTIANLDSDSNYEIVISGRLNTQTEDGKIIAYDASTGSQQWSYDDSGTLKTAFVAPDIADMNSDGKYDIIFGENNGSKVHIVNSSGGKNFTYTFNAFIDSALAIADIDGDGKAEIALKREGSPYGILAVASSFNRPPQLGNISNRTARAGEMIDLNISGEVVASDPDGAALTFSFSSPFNSSGKWQTTVNDTGNYSIMVEVSDGSLTDFTFVDVFVFNQTAHFAGNFSDGTTSKLLNYTSAANETISVRLPKNATIVYSRIKLEGRGS